MRAVRIVCRLERPTRAISSLDDRLIEAGLSDRSLYELEERTTIMLDDEVEAASNALSTAARVTVRLRDGRELSMLVRAPKGSPARPFSGAEHEARFARELSGRVSDQTIAEIIAMANDLDRLDPRWLGRVLAAPGSAN